MEKEPKNNATDTGPEVMGRPEPKPDNAAAAGTPAVEPARGTGTGDRDGGRTDSGTGKRGLFGFAKADDTGKPKPEPYTPANKPAAGTAARPAAAAAAGSGTDKGGKADSGRKEASRPLAVDPITPADKPAGKETITERKAREAAAKQVERASDEAIEQIVTGGVKALFLGIGAFMRPQWALPAWQLEDADVKRPVEHFARYAKTLTPEQAELLQKYADPLLGCLELYAVYRLAANRERELYAYLTEMVGETGGTGGGLNTDAGGTNPDNGRNPARPADAAGNSSGRFRSTL